jgi:rod shape-determining protein MreD
MPILFAIPFLGLLVILQSAVVNRMPLLHGTADLLLLTITAWALRPRVRTHWYWAVIGGLLVSLFTALPVFVFLVGYLMATALAVFLRQRVWKAPLLAMFSVVFIVTVLIHLLTVFALGLQGTLLPLLEVLNQVTLPSLLLNLLLAVPIYAIIGDIADRFYPEELEV